MLLQYSNEEERQLQQALENSRVLRGREKLPIDEAPTFYPTQDEFADPLKYINRHLGDDKRRRKKNERRTTEEYLHHCIHFKDIRTL